MNFKIPTDIWGCVYCVKKEKEIRKGGREGQRNVGRKKRRKGGKVGERKKEKKLRIDWLDGSVGKNICGQV